MDWGLFAWLSLWSLGGFLVTGSAVYGASGSIKVAIIAGLGSAGTYLLGKLQESPLARKYGAPKDPPAA